MEKSQLLTESLAFSFEIIAVCKVLRQENQWIIADQLLRSSTSIGANVYEAQSAESKKDFIHKFSIASKEAWETAYWLKITEKVINLSPDLELKRAVIHRMINKSISTVKKNMGQR
jgi:four helix bundle protein